MTNWAARAPRSTVVEVQETSGQDTLAWAWAPFPPAYWFAMSLLTWLILSLISPGNIKMKKLSDQTSLKIFKEKSNPKPHCPLLLQLAGQSPCRAPFHSAAQSLCWKRRSQICWKFRMLKFIGKFTCAHLWQSSWCPWSQTQAPADWRAQHSPRPF